MPSFYKEPLPKAELKKVIELLDTVRLSTQGVIPLKNSCSSVSLCLLIDYITILFINLHRYRSPARYHRSLADIRAQLLKRAPQFTVHVRTANRPIHQRHSKLTLKKWPLVWRRQLKSLKRNSIRTSLKLEELPSSQSQRSTKPKDSTRNPTLQRLRNSRRTSQLIILNQTTAESWTLGWILPTMRERQPQPLQRSWQLKSQLEAKCTYNYHFQSKTSCLEVRNFLC